MKVDLYTKVVLTGILICLSLMLLRDAPIVDKAYAELNGAIPSNITIEHRISTPKYFDLRLTK